MNAKNDKGNFKEYRIRWSRLSIMVTIVGTLLALGLTLVVLYDEGFSKPCNIIIVTVVYAAFVVAYGLHPHSVAFGEKSLLIRRTFGTKELPYTDIVETGLHPASFRFKICGTGGVFGHLGWYRVEGLGAAFSYVTDRDQTFYVKMKDGRIYLLSSYDPEDVVMRLRKIIGENG